MQVAVVGHVEWVEFFSVDGPPHPGAILHARSSWEEPAGGGGVAAAELARLAGACVFHTAMGSDARGGRLPAVMAELGVEVRGPVLPGPHRRGISLGDPSGERTIIVCGDSQAPTGLNEADFDGVDAVYFCKGDVQSLRAARRARVLVTTARVLDIVRAAEVQVDALVASAVDPKERYEHGDLACLPNLVAITEGEEGGRWWTSAATGRWKVQPIPGEVRDAYGCGDSFAAGLTFALAQRRSIGDALAFAASRGAVALVRSGAHGGGLRV